MDGELQFHAAYRGLRHLLTLYLMIVRNKTLEELAAVFGDEVGMLLSASPTTLTAMQVAETLDEAGQHMNEKERAMGTHVETVEKSD